MKNIYVIPTQVLKSAGVRNPETHYTLKQLQRKWKQRGPIKYPSRTTLTYWANLVIQGGATVKNCGRFNPEEKVTVVTADPLKGIR